MTRPIRASLVIAFVALASTISAIVAFGGGASAAEVWTDGAAIRVPSPTAAVREVLWTPAVPLPGRPSGSTDEYEPRYDAGGTTLIFVRRRPGDNADLYSSRWSPAGWSEPAPIESINTAFDELGPEFSRDGTALYFYSDRPEGLGGYDLWISRSTASGWGAPLNLGQRINSPWNEFGPALTPGGDRIFFSSNRPRDGEPAGAIDSWSATVRERRVRHDYDLFSAPMNGAGTEPAARIAVINTPEDEGAPSVSPGGDFLYFASDRKEVGGRRVSGGFDLYRARVSRDNGVQAPENLGPQVNSAANDLDPTLSSDGFRLCFSSDRPSPGAAEAGPGRYMLWSSVSREVYREVDGGPSAASTAVGRLWPWLLLLVLLLALAILIVRLIRDERWRQRFGRLSLIAQCLIVSLLIHAGIASLLTVWKIGAGIIDLMQPPRGGQRVLLASGAPSGSIVSQVRETITSGALPLFQASALAAPLRTEPIRAQSGPTPLPTPAALPREPLAHVQRAAPAPVETPDQPPIVPLSPRSGLENVLLPAPAGQEPAAPEPEAGELAFSVPPLAAPVVPSASVAAPPPVMVDVAPSTPPTADAPSLHPDAPRSDSNLVSRRPTAIQAPPPAGFQGAPLPAAPPGSAGPVESAAAERSDSMVDLIGASTGAAVARRAAPPALSFLPPGEFVTLDVPGAHDRLDESARVRMAAPTIAIGRSAQAAPVGGSMSLPSPLATTEGVGVDLPPAGEAPVESFSQRDPESREALVNKMGGSGETERAVGLALEWFARHQSPDGHWSAQGFDEDCGACGGVAEVQADTAMTGMALLCYLGAGHTHTRPGPYRATVDSGIKWLLARQASDGDLRRGETMYGQTVAAVALCEAFSMTRDPALSAPARSAVGFVLTRAASGRSADDRDTSVIGWLVFTVESARRAGIDVPRRTFIAAADWLDAVTVPGSPGLYAYARGQPASAAMTAEAMFVRQLLGHTREEAPMQRSAELLLGELPSWKEGAPTYYWYYATLALFQHQGEGWKTWNDALVKELLAHQQQEGPVAGSWQPQDEWSRLGGRIYQTAVCTLCLEVYYRYRAIE